MPGGFKMKYNQFAIKNQKGLYIKYGTAYRDNPDFTDSLYDVHLWNLKVDAERLSEYMNNEGNEKLIVVPV